MNLAIAYFRVLVRNKGEKLKNPQGRRASPLQSRSF